MSESDTYTVVLSNATHAVSAKDAEAITAAVESGKPVIEIEMDLFGDGAFRRPVRLMTRHVVMVFPNHERDDDDNELFAFAKGKIRRLHAR